MLFINETMRAEIEFIRQALRENSWAKFEVSIALSFQGLHPLSCLETVPSAPAADTPLLYEPGGIYRFQTLLLREPYFI
jgi:hypothetical protein